MAAMGGSTKMIHFLVGQDIPDVRGSRRTSIPNTIDIQDRNCQTPLIIASRMSHVEATKLLVQLSADCGIQDAIGRTALYYAILNCPATVEDLVTRDVAWRCDNDGCTPLHVAARFCNARMMSTLMTSLRTSDRLDEAIHARDSQGKTPLHYAAENGHTNIVEEVLYNEGSVGLEDDFCKEVAELAAKCGNLTALRALMLATEADIRIELLEAASGTGQLLVVLYLLDKEFDSSNEAKFRNSKALSLAASNGHIEVVRTLLQHEAAIDTADDYRQTPLHHAAKNGSYEIVETLLSSRANINRVANANAPDKDRNTPLHSAAMAGNVGIIRLLLKHEAKIEARSRTRETALHLAVKYPEAVRALLEAGANPNASDTLSQTPLHKAASARSSKSAQLLLDSKADPDTQDDDGRLPLYFAIAEDDLLTVEVLRKDRRCDNDLSAEAEWAVESSALNVLDSLLTQYPKLASQPDGRGNTLLHKAAKKDSPGVLNLLLQLAADVNIPDRWGMSPLHIAAYSNCLENMRRLLEVGAEVGKLGLSRETPLHRAATLGFIEAVDVLLEANADFNRQDDEGNTPLFAAAYRGQIEIVKKLLQHGADTKLVNSKGWSPLHLAADNIEVTKLLLAHGADVNISMEDGWTPLHLAIIRSCLPTIKLLLENGADFKAKTLENLSCLSLAVQEDAQVLKWLLSKGSQSSSGPAVDFEDMVVAYWRSITLCFPDCVETLVKQEGRLLEELSEKGYTGLETCIGNRGLVNEEEAVAICLVKLGADPFEPCKVGRESSFQRSLISRRAVRLDFIKACMERLPKDISSASGLGFKDLRIATELGIPDLWRKLEPLREEASAATDHDGWSLEHFIHQSAGRVPAQIRDSGLQRSYKTPTALILPLTWVPLPEDVESRVQIAPSGLEVSFAGEYRSLCSLPLLC